jgi:hypothetical protein
VKGTTREDERSNPSRFSRKSSESRRYNSMRLFTMSIRQSWHSMCVPANIMTPGRTMLGLLIAVGVLLIFSHQVPAQPSTAPPSSLSTRPLAPGSSESEIRTSCDLCRKPEGKPGSDLRPQRLRREKGLRPRKNPKGTHRSLDQSLKSTLPRRPFAPPDSQAQWDSQTKGPAE